MKKKLLYLVMVVALLSLLFPVSAIAADGGRREGESKGTGPPEPGVSITEPPSERHMLDLVKTPKTTITLDGNPADWVGILPIVQDTHYDSVEGWADDDIWNVWATDDGSNLYFMVELGYWAYWCDTNLEFWIDADQNAATGINPSDWGWCIDPNHTIGADYLIEVSTWWEYVDLYTVPDFSYIGSCPLGLDAMVEIAVPLGWLGGSPPYDMFFGTYYYMPQDDAPNTGHVPYPTGPPPPSVTTNPATAVTATSATLHGNLDSLGDFSSADVSFGWDTVSHSADPSAYSNWTTAQTVTTGAFSDSISGLTPLNRYYFCARAQANGITVYGDELYFDTPELLVFTVSTSAATDITLTSATLNGYLDSLGPTYTSADVSFGWDTVSHSADPATYPNWTSAQTLSAAGAFSADISSLIEKTEYFFRAAAFDGVDTTVYGDELSFTTHGPDDWTFMVYLDGDNNLEEAAIDDFLEMSSVGSSAAVNIVVQFDRISGYTALYDDWTTTKRFYVTPGMTPTAANAVQDLGELNMADPRTLVDFVLWTIDNYPADHYALVLWDHGSGWKLQENSNPLKGVCWDDTSAGDYLTSPELAEALFIIYAETGAKLDIVGFDACLMGMAEIFYLIAPYADYGVASQEVEWLDGWPYDTILSALIAVPTPGMAPDVLASDIVDKYMASYAPAEIETMSAVQSSGVRIPTVASAVSALATSLIASGDSDKIFWARIATEETYYDPGYIDLYHFCEQLQAKFTTGTVYDNAGIVMEVITSAIVNEGHGIYHPNFHGMSIYFPLMVADYWGNYAIALDFTADTQWDEFVEWFYTQPMPAPSWEEFITDPEGDQFAGVGPDIAGVDGAVIDDPYIAFRVRAYAPLNFADIESVMVIDADQDITTGYYVESEFPIGIDYIAIVSSSYYMSAALDKWLPTRPEEIETKQGLFGMLAEWDPVDEMFYYVDYFLVFTNSDRFWYPIPVSLMCMSVGPMDIIEILGTWTEFPTDIAPDEDYGTFPPVELPDLVISAKSEAWTDGTETAYTVSFTVHNQGTATALAGHDVTLYIDGVEQAEHVEVTADLAPGASWSSSFATPITLFGLRNTITVCADHFDEVVESNERNNSLTNVFPEVTLADALALGKVWLAAQQKPDGSWGVWNQVAKTGLAVLKFETQAVEELIVPIDATYTYYSQIVDGLDYILSNAHITAIGPQPAGDPDSDGDGHGVYFHSPGNYWPVIYETSIAVMAISASTHPEWVVTGGPLDGWTYEQVVRNAVDYLAWAQTDFGYGRGGWDYGPHDNSGDRSDQSNSGYATLALSYAEAPLPRGFGLPIPGMVRTELDIWVDYIQNTDGGWEDGGSGYDNPNWPNILRTGNLLQQFAWLGDTVAEPRVQAAIDYLVRAWDTPSEPGWRGDPASYQATFTTMKGLEPLFIDEIDGINWFQDFIDVLLAQQNPDGSWPVCAWDDGDQILATEWALLTLEKVVPEVIEKPDLVISDKGEQWVVEEETYTVTFIVRNRGNVAVVSQDHQVALYVDDQLIEEMAFPIDLAPGKTSDKGTFNTVVTLTDEWDNVVVCADSTNVVDELNEDNNCYKNIWTLLTVEVEDATITACSTTSVDVWVRNFPLTVDPDTGAEYGLGCYTINIHYDPRLLDIIGVTPGDAPFDAPTFNIYPDYVSVTQFSTVMPGPTGDVRLFDLEFHCLGQGETELWPEIVVLANTNGDELPAISDPGLIRQVWVEADTFLGQDQEPDVDPELVVIVTGILRLKDPSTGETVTGIPIGCYEATAYYDPAGIVMLDVMPGEPPFDNPVVGPIYPDYTEFVQATVSGSEPPILAARLVLRLVGRATDRYALDVPFDLIADTDANAIPEQETASITFQRGDVNDDGRVNIIDAMKGAQHLVGIPEAADINFLNMASVHHDDGWDKKTIIDCMFIAQYVVGILDGYFN